METPAPVLTIEVDSIDESLQRIAGEGGTVVRRRTPMGDIGAYAYFKGQRRQRDGPLREAVRVPVSVYSFPRVDV